MHAYRPSQNWGLVVELIEPHFTLEWFGPGTNRQGFWLEGGVVLQRHRMRDFRGEPVKKEAPVTIGPVRVAI